MTREEAGRDAKQGLLLTVISFFPLPRVRLLCPLLRCPQQADTDFSLSLYQAIPISYKKSSFRSLIPSLPRPCLLARPPFAYPDPSQSPCPGGRSQLFPLPSQHLFLRALRLSSPCCLRSEKRSFARTSCSRKKACGSTGSTELLRSWSRWTVLRSLVRCHSSCFFLTR
jgi:hypothetical protein